MEVLGLWLELKRLESLLLSNCLQLELLLKKNLLLKIRIPHGGIQIPLVNLKLGLLHKLVLAVLVWDLLAKLGELVAWIILLLERDSLLFLSIWVGELVVHA